jgi:Copper binding proteins, plastocyanin/azurin family
MSWLAILLSLAAFGGGSHGAVKPTKHQCKALKQVAKQKQCLKAMKPKTPPKAKPKSGPPQKPGASQPSNPGAQRDDAPSKQPADPDAAATPAPGASPTPAPTATPSLYPSRTGVELTDTNVWSIRLSYRILAAGRIDFVTTNVGEDDHNLSVRAGGREYGRLDIAPGRDDTLTLDLAVGTYTLYCSLTGHEEAGMKATISVR